MLTETAGVLCFLSILAIPLAIAGLALINTGLGRSRNAAHMMLGSLCVIAVAGMVYVVVGFSWAGYRGGAGYGILVQGRLWEWLGAMPLFLRGLTLGLNSASLTALLGLMSVAFAAVIPLGSAADRWKLGGMCLSTVFLAGVTYPLFAHWAWAGWLDGLGRDFGLGVGFLDAGGAGAIQVVGGFTALSLTWILGPRRGKFTPDRMPLAIPGHNSVFVLFGCLLCWLGWIGLDCAGAMLYTGADVGRVVQITINASLGAASSALVVAAITRIRFGKPDASLCANGWIGGLVATSAGCAAIPPAAAMIIGMLGGVMITYSIEWLELHLSIDDPGGAISVHALGGLWGLLAAGWFARLGDPKVEGSQWMAQIAGMATLVGFVLPLTYGINWVLNRFRPMRVPPEGERLGLDLYELGAGAYPDFLTHNDDLQR
jgi:ammonium transporter, Amt family